MNSETQAIVQDSCERWWLCYEYCRKWNPGFEQRIVLQRSLSKAMRAAVRELNSCAK